jgi:L-lysine exporter family protein LysE/ArgO
MRDGNTQSGNHSNELERIFMNTTMVPVFAAGLTLGLSLIMAIGPQNAHVLRMGLQRQHVVLTACVCMVADVVLIAVGVLGMTTLGGLSPKLHGAMLGAGILFLSVYGYRAAQRAWQGSATAAMAHAPPAKVAMTKGQAILSALVFSWLNPHAWLDAAVLIGSAALAYGDLSKVFGLGAAAGSVLWFGVLGLLAFWLGQRINNVLVWRVIDAMVALMMWGTAVVLVKGLL